MSNTLRDRVPYFFTSNDREMLLWDSAHILDSEEHQGDHHVVEWVDNEGRRCQLSSKAFAARHHISEEDHYYGSIRYIFTRHDPNQNITRTYFIESDKKKKIKQYDQDMEVLPAKDGLAQKAVIQSIMESYDEFAYQVMTEEEEAAFYTIVAEYKKGMLRRFGRTAKNIAARIW